jgi:hypothetical protein
MVTAIAWLLAIGISVVAMLAVAQFVFDIAKRFLR